MAAPRIPVHAFVDGAYLRKLVEEANRPWPNPFKLCHQVAIRSVGRKTELCRVTYYDAEPEDLEAADPELASYWDAVERLDYTHLGMGFVRGRQARRGRQQKGVDTLIAVHMVEGAFNGIFEHALLVTGDADFVPVIEAVHRRGARVTVAGSPETTGDRLKRAADRFLEIDPTNSSDWQALEKRSGGVWRARPKPGR